MPASPSTSVDMKTSLQKEKEENPSSQMSDSKLKKI